MTLLEPMPTPYSGPEHQPFQFGEGPGGALLIHGFPGTPAEVRGLGQTLSHNGWQTRGPLLPGFGPDIMNLAYTRREDWLGAVRQEWAVLRARHTTRLLVGYSMGAALALHLAHEAPPDKLVLIAPFWRLPGLLPKLVPLLRLVIPEMRPFKNADFDVPEFRTDLQRVMPEADLDDPQVQAYIREEITLPLAVIHDVFRLGSQAYRLARSISVPTLVIQGGEDALARPELTRKLAQRLGSEWVSYHELSGGHELIQAHAEQSTHVSELILEYVGGEP
jgi:carboxylesterase